MGFEVLDQRNWVAKQARGEYLVTIGSDDVMLPDALASLLAARDESPDCDFYYGDLVVTDSKLEPKMRLSCADYGSDNGKFASSLVFTSQICDGFGMMRRQFLLDNGGYSSSFAKCHDWEFWSRTSDRIRLRRVGSALGYWRWHDDNISTLREAEEKESPDRVLRQRNLRLMSPGTHLRNLGWGLLGDNLEGRSIAIWGAGAYGISVKWLLEYAGFKANYFVDSDSSKEGSRIEGLLVRGPKQAQKDRPLVIIGSVYEGEIAASLESMGFKEGVDYLRPHGLEYVRL